MSVDLDKIIRTASFIMACMLWYMSITFSIAGFNFEMNATYSAYGLMLALTVTVMELVWNHYGDKASWTIKILGMLCYGYGIYTNIIGIGQGRGGVDGFAIVLGLILEVSPEPLFVLALLGNNRENSGFFENMIGKVTRNVGDRPNGQKKFNPNNQQPHSKNKNNNQPFRSGKKHNEVPDFMKPRPPEMTHRESDEFHINN